MKLFTSLVTMLVLSNILIAQNVGIGTNTPHTSALLELNSTTKGLLLPRMTTAQRMAIASPVLGLMVFDTDTKSMWVYEEADWKNANTGVGLLLPFSQTVNLGISAFQVTNQGIGAAIEGASTNEFGTGTIAKATGEFGRGLFAFTDKAGGSSIYAIADNGKVFHGENNNTGNTNTLMSLLNRGLAKTATFQLANTGSNDANVQIAGNNLGEQLLIFQTNAANAKPAISVSNSGTGIGVSSVANNGTGVTGTSNSGTGIIGTSSSSIGVSGVSNTNYGVKGITNSSGGFAGVRGENTGTAGTGVVGVSDAVNTQGVYGTSTNGIGVRAASNNYRAVQASTTSGTALFGSSTSGYSLDISGNVKIAGGNTNPGAGKVLTSDASGNATWQTPVVATPKVGFRAYGISSSETGGTPNNSIPNNTFKKVEFQTESYDTHGDFIITGNTPATSTKSAFTAPFRGVYHFDAAVSSTDNFIFNHYSHKLRLRYNRGGNISTIAEVETVPEALDGSTIQISMDVFLEADDMIWLEFQHYNLSFSSITLETSGIKSFFSGHLMYTQ